MGRESMNDNLCSFYIKAKQLINYKNGTFLYFITACNMFNKWKKYIIVITLYPHLLNLQLVRRRGGFGLLYCPFLCRWPWAVHDVINRRSVRHHFFVWMFSIIFSWFDSCGSIIKILISATNMRWIGISFSVIERSSFGSHI